MFGNYLNLKICLGLISLLFSILLTYILKNYINSRTPTGRKDGLLDYSIVISFTTVSIIAMLTKDPFIVSLTVLLAYIISKNKYENKKNYLYQIVLSILIGLAVPYFIFLLNEKWEDYRMFSYEKDYNEEFPEKDNKDEARKHSEYKLEEIKNTGNTGNTESDDETLSSEERELLMGLEE